jgi:hypothetical protein
MHPEIKAFWERQYNVISIPYTDGSISWYAGAVNIGYFSIAYLNADGVMGYSFKHVEYTEAEALKIIKLSTFL